MTREQADQILSDITNGKVARSGSGTDGGARTKGVWQNVARARSAMYKFKVNFIQNLTVSEREIKFYSNIQRARIR
ncbi:hypothetical protein [uncultured Campylobacter sp.]|uniref:hypothetical protein n=1 Tax=uncultured Campylobacter sp. TaxID=218934 RepID=UPI002625EC0D|nr:hypothetical protein [uncultured Campylobacter sp.]